MTKTQFQYLILVTWHLLRRAVFGLLILKNDCTCPGYPLIYECTVYGEPGGTTVWTGTAFNCTNREISLFHSNYGISMGAYGECDNIEGQSVRIIDNTGSTVKGYVSQLIVRVRSDTIGKSIECQYDDGSMSTLKGEAIVTATTAPFPPPERMYLSNTDLYSRELTFKWNTVAPKCPAISYNILASNCGNCPTITNHTTTRCKDVPTNGNSCMFALETVVCGHIVGNKSETIQGTLKGCSGCTGAIVSAILLAVTLSICIAVFTTVIIYLVRNKLNIKGKISIKSWRISGSSGRARTSDYEGVRHDDTGRPKSAIDTRKNIAYGQPHTVSTSTSK